MRRAKTKQAFGSRLTDPSWAASSRLSWPFCASRRDHTRDDPRDPPGVRQILFNTASGVPGVGSHCGETLCQSGRLPATPAGIHPPLRDPLQELTAIGIGDDVETPWLPVRRGRDRSRLGTEPCSTGGSPVFRRNTIFPRPPARSSFRRRTTSPEHVRFAESADDLGQDVDVMAAQEMEQRFVKRRRFAQHVPPWTSIRSLSARLEEPPTGRDRRSWRRGLSASRARARC